MMLNPLFFANTAFKGSPSSERRALLAMLAGTALPGSGKAATPEGVCVAPSKAGGGYDLTCALVANALQTLPDPPHIHTHYMPGGVGALAFHQAASGAMPNENTMVAFSSGSLLNIAQRRFGPHSYESVHWLCTLGTDYGVVVVRPQSRLRQLKDLINTLHDNVGRIAFGAGGTMGSQDWCKAALLVRAAKQDHRLMRFVAFEGGGEAMKALLNGEVDVCTGDAAEVWKLARQKADLRVLAVLAPARLADSMGQWATAREQDVDLVWPTVRGLYMPPQVPAATFARWEQALRQAQQSPGYGALCHSHGLQPQALTGPALRLYIQSEMQRYTQLMQTLGLRKW